MWSVAEGRVADSWHGTGHDLDPKVVQDGSKIQAQEEPKNGPEKLARGWPQFVSH